MARQLFVKDNLNEDLIDLISKLQYEDLSTFWKRVFIHLESLVKSELESLDLEASIKERLYFLGSFARGWAGPKSDLDLLVISKSEEKVSHLNSKLRTVFSNYSLKKVDSIEDLFVSSDYKSILSCWFARPVFKEGKEVRDEIRNKISQDKIEDLKSWLRSESNERHQKFGGRAGGLKLNIKNSPGGTLDFMQLSWWCSLKNESPKVDLNTHFLFLYKCRLLFNLYFESDNMNFSNFNKVALAFGHRNDQIFFKVLYSNLWKVFEALEEYKGSPNSCNLKSLIGSYASDEELAHAEADLFHVRGLVLAPSYHVWTVDQHILETIQHVKFVISEYKDKFFLQEDEVEVLHWAAFFHDLKKGGSDSHSILGARAAQDFGRQHNWPSRKTGLVSWLVREHLSLVKHSFKMDIFHPDFVKTMVVKGCEGRRAILLFLLTCADIKATNPGTWNDWKKGMLERALNRILGVQDSVYENLNETLKKAGTVTGRKVLDHLGMKEICMVPFELLVADLSSLCSEGVQFYEDKDRIWIRFYYEKDIPGFAQKSIESIAQAGAYIHHASFKTLPNGEGIYNWVCVETGVSPQAFKKRFEISFLHHKDSHNPKRHVFKGIRKNFEKDHYAVLSFKGADGDGALASALGILKDAQFNIEWGHAVTWGSQIEDIFGVSFKDEPDWSFLTRPEKPKDPM